MTHVPSVMPLSPRRHVTHSIIWLHLWNGETRHVCIATQPLLENSPKTGGGDSRKTKGGLLGSCQIVLSSSKIARRTPSALPHLSTLILDASFVPTIMITTWG